MSQCAHKGSLHVLMTGVGNEQRWQKRFYVLYNVTSTTAARLECHQDEKSFKTKQPPQHVYSINDVSKIKDSTKQGHNETHKFTFEIVYSSQKKEILFSAQSHEDMTKWTMVLKASLWEQDQANKASVTTHDSENISLQNSLYESVQTIPDLTYMVDVDETEASKRCQLLPNKTYQLHICQSQLTLVNLETGTSVCEWPYKLIRRYGRSTSQFSFEAGRRCASGAGLFNFHTAMADKLFTDVRSRTMAMRENQHDGDSGEIVVENPRRPPPTLAPLATPRPAANAKPATAKPVAASQAPAKPVVVKPVPVAAPRTPTGSKPILTKTDSGNVTAIMKKFQDNTDGLPIDVRKAPLTAKLSSDKDKISPAPYVPTKSDEEKRKKDAAKLTKEMKMKDPTSIRASEAKGKVSNVHLHQKKLDTAPPPRPADPKDSSRVPNKLQARNLPSLPKASPEVESADYDVAYTSPNDSEYSETYAEISQTSCAVNATDDTGEGYTYAEVGKGATAAATTQGDMKMSSVAADMSRNRGRAPAAVPKGGSGGDTYDFLDFAGVANAPKETDQSSGNIYGHLSTVVATEDEAGYADPVSLKDTRTQKNSKN